MGITNQQHIACRFCGNKTFEVLDLGNLPLANSLMTSPSGSSPGGSSEGESVDSFPTALHVCSTCSTAQLSYCTDLNVLYKDYVYITPDSTMLSEHYQLVIDYLIAQQFVSQATRMLEIGSNIGRFLAHCEPYVYSILGVDPADNITHLAIEAGVPTVNDFFNKASSKRIADQYGKVDFIAARHCFAHNEKPWEMLEGVDELLTDEGVFVIENAYFPDTIEKGEFDQIYHEHMYYYNLRAIQQVSQRYGFKLIDCMHSDVHGGTMLYIVVREGSDRAKADVSEPVKHYLKLEESAHLMSYYTSFVNGIESNKLLLKQLLEQLQAEGKIIHAYGASAKSVTLLHYFGIDASLIPYVVDSTITKHGKYLPLTEIQVISEEQAQLNPADYYLLTIWNYKDEIIKKVRESGNLTCQFILPHPYIQVVDSSYTLSNDWDKRMYA